MRQKRPKRRTIQIHKSLPGQLAGSELEVDVDNHGTPLSPYWRARIKDGKIDGYCSFKPLVTKGAKS